MRLKLYKEYMHKLFRASYGLLRISLFNLKDGCFTLNMYQNNTEELSFYTLRVFLRKAKDFCGIRPES